MASRTVYGLDIEIDRSVDARDPAVAPIVKVAIAGPGFEEVFTGRERHLLRAVDDRLRALPAGVIATWQGSSFDLPFLADRAARVGVGIGLRLQLDPSLPSTQQPLIGHEGAYRAAWYDHRHIDACRVCNGEMVGPGRLSGAWRSFVDLIGLGPANAATGDDGARDDRAVRRRQRCPADPGADRAPSPRRPPEPRPRARRVPARAPDARARGDRTARRRAFRRAARRSRRPPPPEHRSGAGRGDPTEPVTPRRETSVRGSLSPQARRWSGWPVRPTLHVCEATMPSPTRSRCAAGASVHQLLDVVAPALFAARPRHARPRRAPPSNLRPRPAPARARRGRHRPARRRHRTPRVARARVRHRWHRVGAIRRR